jgi:dTDP-4-dehydrorhamnose reductase
VRVLIAGGDGLLGPALTRRLVEDGHAVRSTTRRPERAGPDRPLLDLEASPATWPQLDADCLVLCAARTSVRECEDDATATRRINVEALIELARRAHRSGAWTCLPSTTLVFDGLRPDYTIEERPAPACEYGRQKAELEAALIALAPERSSIVRIGKVVDRGVKLFGDWLAALSERRSIRAFRDLIMAPVSLEAAVDVLARVVTGRAPRIAHFTAAGDVSYADAGLVLASALGVDSALVRGEPAPAGIVLPRHASLDCRETARILSVRIPAPEEAIASLVRVPHAGAATS